MQLVPKARKEQREQLAPPALRVPKALLVVTEPTVRTAVMVSMEPMASTVRTGPMVETVRPDVMEPMVLLVPLALPVLRASKANAACRVKTPRML